MSQSHIREETQPLQPIVWWKIALCFAGVVALFSILYLSANWIHSLPSTYETTTGKVLEIRKVVDGTTNSQFGSRIIYGVEARVRYEADGQTRDRWLRASDNMPKESLLLKLAANPTECLVYWPPNHPENAKCSFK